MNGKMKKVIVGIIVLAILVGGMLFAYQKFGPKSSDVKSGAKEITVVVEHGNKEKKEFVYQTDEKYLGAVLQKEKLVEGTMGEYGLFILSVDGEKADDSKQQWWCVTKSKKQVNTGADKTPIKDGDIFELTLTEGY